jgi:hypothetical protein
LVNDCCGGRPELCGYAAGSKRKQTKRASTS